MNWTITHLVAGELLGLSPKLSISELTNVQGHIAFDHRINEDLKYKMQTFENCIHTFNAIDQQIQYWQKELHYTLLTPFCLSYPTGFLRLPDPPRLLFLLGTPSWENAINFAVVGKREARPHTVRWMHDEFYKFLEHQKALNIISGGARGVDQKAHSGAIIHHLKTTVLLPSGLNNIYPSTLLDYKTSILENGGCFLSHYLPDTQMHKKNFHHRNQLIAALADMCLIIEAEKRSGTYKTALYCQEMGTPMAVLPSFPMDQSYSGSLQLIYDGSTMVRDHKDLSCFLSLNTKTTISMDEIQNRYSKEDQIR